MGASVEPARVLAQVGAFCRKAFEKGSEGKRLAAKLGLTDERVLERLRAGYADASLMKAIPTKGPLREGLIAMGLLTKDGALAIEGCLVIPAPNREGDPIGLVAIRPDGAELRFPAALPLYGLNPVPLGGKTAVLTNSVLRALLYLQAGVVNVLPLTEDPDEEAFLRANRPAKVFLDAEGLLPVLQALEVPCFRLSVEWPADLAHIEAAMAAAPAIEARVGTDASTVIAEGVVRFTRGGRNYEVADLDPADAERMRVRLRALCGGAFHLDTLDLYAARSRVNFAKAAAGLFGTAPADVEADLCLMIRKLEAIREAEDKKRRRGARGYAMTADEEAEALDYLKVPDLLGRIVRDMATLGYVGEDLNKKLGYLISLSRRLESPLCGVVLSRAGSGKSSLLDLLAEMAPPEDLIRFTRMTSQALYYADRSGLRHKLLMAGEDEGLLGADYALRELISSKKIKLAVPVREPETGRFRIEEYEVEGPIALLLSTTKPAIHFENATRCFILSLDESAEQTRAIHEAQRRARAQEGLGNRSTREDLRRLHRNIQRLIKPLLVVNPFAPYLEFPTQPLEMRREHEKYLSLIDAIALLHQHQRRRGTTVVNGREVGYVEAAVEDVEEANRLMTEILGTCRDELSRPSKELLALIRQMVEEKAKATGIAVAAVRFNRRDIREFTGWSDSQIKSHIGQLEELEYLLVGRTERGKTFRYELAHSGLTKRISGLTDTAKLRALRLPGANGVGEKSGMVWRGLAGVGDPKELEVSNAIRGKSLKVWQNGHGGIGA